MAKKEIYNNESITMLKGPDKVRKRPGVIFGSDGVDGCAHSVFEIVSNSIDEARSGFGDKIIVTQYNDHSITVEDFGRGCPVDFNSKENRYNWELRLFFGLERLGAVCNTVFLCLYGRGNLSGWLLLRAAF